MSWRNPRRILVVCAGLDLAGLIGLAVLISLFKPVPLFPQLGWLLFTALAYLGLGWLFHGWKTQLSICHGYTPDILAFLQFRFWERCISR